MHKVFTYFEIAARLTMSKKDRRQFLLGAVGIRHDGTMVSAINAPTEVPQARAHAETRLCRKLDVGSVVFVARCMKGTGQFALAKPCPSCLLAMRSRRVKRVYYTTGPDSYEVLNLTKPTPDYEYK